MLHYVILHDIILHDTIYVVLHLVDEDALKLKRWLLANTRPPKGPQETGARTLIYMIKLLGWLGLGWLEIA